ncbi:MAG: adenine phosphoribosyltransferase [Clostridia bacterium]|nr:adenine phosphoribosyltransferase [Oscillospiraceae bacterium]MBQ7005434.1 adenine phosphoribosyltransferase [Clostridia bacterium]
MSFYKMTIAGLERELPICKVNDKLDIAGFVIFGDVEITVASAAELIKKCPEFDAIVAPEAKAIPLAHEMARQSGKPYYICRKGAKLYMQNPVSVNVRSITTDKEQTLFLDSLEGNKLTGKRVVILDDVISTGESLLAVEKLLEKFDTNIVAKAAILAEGDAAKRDDIVFLEELPLFFHD